MTATSNVLLCTVAAFKSLAKRSYYLCRVNCQKSNTRAKGVRITNSLEASRRYSKIINFLLPFWPVALLSIYLVLKPQSFNVFFACLKIDSSFEWACVMKNTMKFLEFVCPHHTIALPKWHVKEFIFFMVKRFLLKTSFFKDYVFLTEDLP